MLATGSRDAATRLAIGIVAVALVALGAAAYLLLDGQRDQRANLRAAYGQRAEIAASTVDSIFSIAFAGQAREAARAFGARRPSQAAVEAQAAEGDTLYVAVADPSGEMLAGSESAPAGLRERLAGGSPFMRRAVQTGYGIADVRVVGGRAVVETAVRFETPFGRRVMVRAAPLETYRTFLSGALRRLPAIVRGEAWVLDGSGRDVARVDVPRSQVQPPEALVTGGATGRYEGGRGATFFRAEQLPRSDWRIIIAAPEEALYSSFASGPSRWLPWVLLALGAVALVAIALLLRGLLRTAGALREANADLARSNADLQQFAYAASHDLSEPLRTVAGFSQLLGKRYAGRLDAEADLYIEHMTSGVDRMQQLIDDLLLYSRVGRQPLQLAPVDLDELLGEVLTAVEPAIRERDARVTSDELPTVVGERGQLAQVLQNLIVNAVKFTAPDVAPEVHVSAAHRDGRWHVSVADNGIGIAGDPEAIFAMFARLHPAQDYPGTGIGLALVKRIVERHDGDIGVTSAPGGGSVFTFSLPDRAPVPTPVRPRTPA